MVGLFSTFLVPQSAGQALFFQGLFLSCYTFASQMEAGHITYRKGSGLDKRYANTLQSWRRLFKAAVGRMFDILVVLAALAWARQAVRGSQGACEG